jgi:oligopeptide transport system substrate-binding protein
VRQAFNATINRRLITLSVLRAGQSPLTTLIPWGRVGNYQSPAPSAEDNAGGGARRLLAQAGYGPQGKPLPPIEIHYNTDATHRDIAMILADTWKRLLGADVRLVNQEWKVWLDSQEHLEYDLSRSSWIADYPDAYSFLSVFESDNANNRTGWKNARYDALLAQAANELVPAARNALLQQAEKILLDELPIFPIYSYVSQNLVNPRLGGFSTNVLNEELPKAWYWKSDEELEASRSSGPRALQHAPAPGPHEGLYPPAVLRQRAAR